jgi:hypothetical protein
VSSDLVNATWRDPESGLVHSVSVEDVASPFAVTACGKVVPGVHLDTSTEVVITCVPCMAGLLRRPPK